MKLIDNSTDCELGVYPCECNNCIKRRIKMTKQLCECDPKCNPSDYDNRTVLFTDEAWHNWYLNDPKRKNKEEYK